MRVDEYQLATYKRISVEFTIKPSSIAFNNVVGSSYLGIIRPGYKYKIRRIRIMFADHSSLYLYIQTKSGPIALMLLAHMELLGAVKLNYHEN